MLILVSAVHGVFLAIFFFFHRYIELTIVLAIWCIIVSKIIPPFDILRRPAFLKEKIPENTAFEQSLYLSSGILFYAALAGVALGVANIFQIPVDLRLLYYCVFFLTSVIYGIYLLFYPKNPNVFVLFRSHSFLASFILTSILVYELFFSSGIPDILLLVDLFLLVAGLSVVIILDRNIPLSNHIWSIYIYFYSLVFLLVGIISLFFVDFSVALFALLLLFGSMYIASPPLLDRMYKKERLPLISWHFFNCLLACSWAICFFLFGYLFWGQESQLLIIVASLIFLAFFWFWVYTVEGENPLFFSGVVLVSSALIGFTIFRIFPPLFWLVTGGLFVFAGSLLLLSRIYKKKPQERILAGGAVLFLCATDIVLIFQDHHLFSLSMVFLFQSLIWYGAYEVFHRQKYAQNHSLH